MNAASPIDRPIAGLRIVDAVRGELASLTRYLAELGARVERIAEPLADPFADVAANAGKLTGTDALAAIGKAHAIVASKDQPIDLAGERARRPALVTMT